MEKREYDQLAAVLDYHMDRYYNQDEPEISDYEYDRLMQRLKQAEREHPDWVTPNSPSQKIGGSAADESGEQVAHRVPMLSIEDVFAREDIVAWVSNVKKIHPDAAFSVEIKVDGVSLSLRYEKNAAGKLKLALAETRGNGHVGGDVTVNAMAMDDIPKELDLDCAYLELRGEVYVTGVDYQRYLTRHTGTDEKLAETPRNLAAATLRQLDPDMVREHCLRMLVFNIQDGPKELLSCHTDGMNQLQKLGIPTVYHRRCTSEQEILSAMDDIEALRRNLPYEIDGIVVKLDHTADRKDFPVGPKYAPGHIAYKFPPDAEG